MLRKVGMIKSNQILKQRKILAIRSGLLTPGTQAWLIFLLFEIFWIRIYYQSYKTQLITVNLGTINSGNGLKVNGYVVEFSIDPPESSFQIMKRNNVYANDDEENEPDPNQLYVPERGYPRTTHLIDYPTSSAEAEVEKHDRLLVQGMYFMKTNDFSPLSKVIAENKNKIEKKVCLNIYLCNRRIPYINSLLMGLSSFSSKEREMDLMKAEVHLLNTEKRKERLHFRYMRETLSKLPFVDKVHNVTFRDEIYSNITDRELIFREMFISDEISGLKICIESRLAYCVMMEEDSIVPVDFMTLLHEQVIRPLEKEGVIRMDGSGAISVLSLYSYYNLVHKGAQRLHTPRYTKNRYSKDAAKINAERFSKGLPPFVHNYDIVEKDYMYGTVAMMYTRDSAIKLVNYLQKVGVDPIHNADEFMNADEYFPNEIGIPRKHVQPSLVNHIGYYSERMIGFTKRGMFSQLNTDSRFMFDAGESL